MVELYISYIVPKPGPCANLSLRVGYDRLFALMSYGQRWRQHRRAAHATMAADVVPQYQGVQVDATRNLLRIISESPHELGSHIKLCALPLRLSIGDWQMLTL